MARPQRELPGGPGWAGSFARQPHALRYVFSNEPPFFTETQLSSATFLGEGCPINIDYRKKGTLIAALAPRSLSRLVPIPAGCAFASPLAVLGWLVLVACLRLGGCGGWVLSFSCHAFA